MNDLSNLSIKFIFHSSFRKIKFIYSIFPFFLHLFFHKKETNKTNGEEFKTGDSRAFGNIRYMSRCGAGLDNSYDPKTGTVCWGELGGTAPS